MTYTEYRKEIVWAANRAESHLSTLPESEHTAYLVNLNSDVLLRMYCEFVKFAGVFMAGHRIKDKCWSILKERKAV